MSAIAFVITGQRDTLYQMTVRRRQALMFRLVQIDDKGQGHRPEVRNPQQTHVARFDQPFDPRRGAGDYLRARSFDRGSVIGHQRGTKRHQLQRQGRFSRPRRAEDQQPAPGDGHAAGV